MIRHSFYFLLPVIGVINRLCFALLCLALLHLPLYTSRKNYRGLIWLVLDKSDSVYGLS